MLRLRQICLIARELDPAIAELEAVLGITTCHRDPAVKKFGLVNALLPIGNNFLEVVAPFRENTAAGRYLERRDGEGGYVLYQSNPVTIEDEAPYGWGVNRADAIDRR